MHEALLFASAGLEGGLLLVFFGEFATGQQRIDPLNRNDDDRCVLVETGGAESLHIVEFAAPGRHGRGTESRCRRRHIRSGPASRAGRDARAPRLCNGPLDPRSRRESYLPASPRRHRTRYRPRIAHSRLGRRPSETRVRRRRAQRYGSSRRATAPASRPRPTGRRWSSVRGLRDGKCATSRSGADAMGQPPHFVNQTRTISAISVAVIG